MQFLSSDGGSCAVPVQFLSSSCLPVFVPCGSSCVTPVRSQCSPFLRCPLGPRPCLGPCGRSVRPVRAAGPCGQSVRSVRAAGPCGGSVWPVRAVGACGQSVRPVRVAGPCGRSAPADRNYFRPRSSAQTPHPARSQGAICRAMSVTSGRCDARGYGTMG